jgi:hypothetical protein
MTRPSRPDPQGYQTSPVTVARLITAAVLIIIVGSLALSRCADARTPPPRDLGPVGDAARYRA